MKLPIKKYYFDQLWAGNKKIEFRDAHITFVCEETGRKLRRDIIDVDIVPRMTLPTELLCSGLFENKHIIRFYLK